LQQQCEWLRSETRKRGGDTKAATAPRVQERRKPFAAADGGCRAKLARMSIERWRTAAQGRSHTVAHAGLVWTVSNAGNLQADLAAQVDETLIRLDSALLAAGSSRQRLLSV
jgi:hypothetical protein